MLTMLCEKRSPLNSLNSSNLIATNSRASIPFALAHSQSTFFQGSYMDASVDSVHNTINVIHLMMMGLIPSKAPLHCTQVQTHVCQLTKTVWSKGINEFDDVLLLMIFALSMG